MGIVFSVQTDSEADCLRELARLCREFGLTPILLPVRSTGTDRWLARATSAPHGGHSIGQTTSPAGVERGGER